MRYKIYIILLFTVSIHAQNQSDSLSFFQSNFNRNQVISSYEKELSVHNLNSRLNFGTKYQNLFIGINSLLHSTLSGFGEKNVKEEQFHNLFGEYNFGNSFTAGFLLKHDVYNDDRQLAINAASVSTGTIFLKYNPYKIINFIPFLGYTRNIQIGEKDYGATYGGELKAEKIKLSDLTLKASGKFVNEDISPRKNTLRALKTDLGSTIGSDVRNNFILDYSEARKDFYFESDSSTANEFDIRNNIQTRTEKDYSLRDRVAFYSSSSKIGFELDGRLGWRDIDRHTRYVSLNNISSGSFDTQIEEFRIDLASIAEYRSRILNTRFKLEYSEKEEKYKTKPIEGVSSIFYDERQLVESKKNNSSKLTTVSIASTVNMSKKNNLLFSIFHRKLVYDTPSEENFDDRDELLSTFQMTFTRYHSPFFELFASLEGSINKMVYIFAERSSNNNTKRVIKLTGGGTYKGSIIRSTNRAEVSANYTVFDFDDLTPNFQSFAFRQFALWDSTNISINNRLSLNFQGYLKLSEQGDFAWTEFTNKPVRYLTELYLLPKIQFKLKTLLVGIGIRYFDLKTFTFNNEGEKHRNTEYRSVGPTSEISFYKDDTVNIKYYGWYEFITSEDNSKREQVNLSLRVTWNI